MMKKTKKQLIKEMIIVLFLLIVVGILIIVLLGKKIYSSSDMDDLLRDMASNFYKNYYYDDISKNKSSDEVKKYLEQYKDMGLKINLQNLSDFDSENNNEKLEKFVKNGIECDKEGTKAIIYPVDPYGKEDFKIETIIDCP